MQNFRDIFGSWFRSLFNFVFCFLNICSVEFDDSQNLWAYWVAWGLGTLRLTRLWIYIWVFKELHLIMWLKILKVFMKKWLFPNRSRINLGWSLDHQGMKKHQSESIGASATMKNIKVLKKVIKSKISQENEEIWRYVPRKRCDLGFGCSYNLLNDFNMTLEPVSYTHLRAHET